MKNIRYFLLLAMTMLFAACSQDDLEDIQPSVPQEGGQDGELVEINVSMDARDTRVEYHEESPNFTWDAGDELLVLGYNASNACQFAETFIMKEGSNTGATATFVGKLRTAEKIKVFYKAPNLSYNVEEADGGVKIDYTGQKQVGKDSSAHLKPYLLIGTADYTTNAQLMSGNLMLTMLNSLLRVEVKSMPAEIGALNKLEVVSNLGTENEQLASINVEGYTAQDGASVLYMAFDPVTMAQNATSSLRLSFDGDKHYCVQADNTKATLNQAGHRYRLTVAATAEELQGGKGLTNWAVESVRINKFKQTLSVFEAGGVTPELIDQAMNGTGKLKVVGGINGADLKAIRERAGAVIGYDESANVIYPQEADIKLFELDFSETTFVVSEDVYFTYIDLGLIPYTIQKTNEIPEFAFYCSRLKSLILPTSAEITAIGHEAMKSAEKLTTITFPKNITTLGNGCFCASGVTNITLPPTITTVEMNAFRSCEALKTFNWNASCPVIPDYCFDGATNLSVLNIAEGVTTIEAMTLGNVLKLKTLVLPRSMTTINGLPQLTSLTIKAPCSQDFKMNNIETGYSKDCDLILDESWTDTVTGNEWKGATWKSINLVDSFIQLLEPMKKISCEAGDYSFEFSITPASTDVQPSVTVQEGVDWVKNVQVAYENGKGTVSYSVDANEAYINNREAKITISYTGAADVNYIISQANKIVYEIDADTHTLRLLDSGCVTPEVIDQAMNGSGKLKVVGAINGVDLKAIRERAGAAISTRESPAEGDIKLFELDFSETTFVASEDVYCGYNGDHKIQNTNEIPAFAFVESRLKSFILPTSTEITTIAASAFKYAGDLANIITFPENITTLGDYCFYASGVTNITLPSTITNVGEYAFSDCEKLETVNWNASCPVIPMGCFNYANLTTFNIVEGVTTIENMAITNTPLKTLVLPRSLNKIRRTPTSMTSLTIKAPYSADFEFVREFFAEDCNLILDASWAPYVKGNEWREATWKSIAYIGEVDSSPLIMLNEAEKQVLSSAGNYSFTFNVHNATTASPTIEVQAGADWVNNPQVTYAEGAGTVTYSVDANEADTERQATITVKYAGAVDQVYTVKQAGKPQPIIALAEQQKQITNASADLSFTFTVDNPTTGNPSVEKQADVAWLRNVQLISFANNTGTVNYSVDANEAETSRQATITVKYAGAMDQVYTIIQNGKSNKLASATFNNTGVLVGIPAQQYAGVTYEALVNFSSFNENNTVIGQEEVFLLRVGDSDKDNNQIHVCFDNLDKEGEAIHRNGSLLSNAHLNANQWYHLAATIKPSGDGVEVALYVNGVLDKSQVFPGVSMPKVGGNGKALDTDNHHGTTKNYNAKRGVFIGRLVDYAWGDRPMNGMMREARVWSEARTAEQIKNNMLSVDAASEGLEAYYKFDGNDVAGTTVTDASGKGHNGMVKAGNITSTEHDPIVL